MTPLAVDAGNDAADARDVGVDANNAPSIVVLLMFRRCPTFRPMRRPRRTSSDADLDATAVDDVPVDGGRRARRRGGWRHRGKQ